MPSAFTVKIKVPPYIKKYLIAKSENYEEPLEFCNKHAFTMMLTNLVTKYHTSNSIMEKEYIVNHLRTRWASYEFVEIRLPNHRIKDVRFYNYLSRQNRQLFINEVSSHFYWELQSFLLRRTRKKVQRKIAIEEFLTLHDITEEDVKFETIYRQAGRILEPYL